ncbi:MAG: DUF4982 domain-containing protein [Bacteroidales bacterium]|nr:DUF4982 domain-containing protein [Bacteroidales bacterium]
MLMAVASCKKLEPGQSRERICINENWKFYKYGSPDQADPLVYDVRPEITDNRDFRPADEQPTEAVEVQSKQQILKPWIMSSGNKFIGDPAGKFMRPSGAPGSDFPFVKSDFDDSKWETVDLPHDWAIEGPFYSGFDAEVGGGMGRLPSPGVAWYRKELDVPAADSARSVFLDIDGAMSYAMVWLNGHLVGGWPYGYASWRLDLTPYLEPGGTNQLAIRLDNPPHSSRWYPGGGIYRNVWLTKTHPVHVAQWGTFIHTRNVSEKRADLYLEVTIDNDSETKVNVEAITEIYAADREGRRAGKAIDRFQRKKTAIAAGKSAVITDHLSIKDPVLWGPPPGQEPNMYTAVTTLFESGKEIDTYETPFGIRSLRFDPDSGLFVNGEHIYIQGVNQHHDLGALGAAFNYRAAERQLEILREMGCNSIRTAHNPPAPELLELTDRMGFLVIDEIFDCWERKKTPLDFHLVFSDWHEQDVRAFIQRDRNHPSVIMWSLGNEVGEQYTGEGGVRIARRLHELAKETDPTRPTALSLNFAKPPMELPGIMDVINLNYQGEGIRNAPAYSHLRGINTAPLYPSFHEAHPDKLIISSENAAALSSRGEYIFPVTEGTSAPAEDGKGADPEAMHVSSYELYTAPFGSSADKVFRSLEMHPYVGGGYVWSGWDYLGEPTPYYLARSSYFGVIDLAGFKKDRFYLYQAHWRPDHPMVHILPHWNWPDRIGKVTPVHVFTSGDEAELFLNGKSLGRKEKGDYEYRIRWDDVLYEPGELKAVAYREGKVWAEKVVGTTGEPAGLEVEADRNTIAADGKDLSFVTIRIVDENGMVVPDANNLLHFSVEGPGELVATDNGDPTDLIPFPSLERKVFNGLALAIVRSQKDQPGTLMIIISSKGIESAYIEITTR